MRISPHRSYTTRHQQWFINWLQRGQITIVDVMLYHFGHTANKRVRMEKLHHFFMSKLGNRHDIILLQCRFFAHSLQKFIECHRPHYFVFDPAHKHRYVLRQDSFEQRTSRYDMEVREVFKKYRSRLITWGTSWTSSIKIRVSDCWLSLSFRKKMASTRVEKRV